jgi:hypothetical protein
MEHWNNGFMKKDLCFFNIIPSFQHSINPKWHLDFGLGIWIL